MNPFYESLRVFGLYLRSQVVIAAVELVLFAIGFGLAHVPAWPLFALLGAICSFIPVFGSLFSFLLVAIVMLLAGRDWVHLAIAFATWVVVQGIEGFILQPILFSKPLGLRALPVFLALLLGSWIFGPVGFLLAVPVLAIANVFWRYFRDRETVRR